MKERFRAKSPSIPLFSALGILVITGVVYAEYRYGVQTSPPAPPTAPAPSPTGSASRVGEIIDIDSEDNPPLGLAGYSSGSLRSGHRSVEMRLLAPDREKIILDSFPCVDARTTVTAVQGTFRVIALAGLNGPILDVYELGKQNFVIDPPSIEQISTFGKKVTLSRNPPYEAFTLAFRRSCYDTEVWFFAYDDRKNQLKRLPFIRKDGSMKEYIYIPKGFFIPQLDDDNVIESAYDPATGWRNKVRYSFDLNQFAYVELESYRQPQ